MLKFSSASKHANNCVKVWFRLWSQHIMQYNDCNLLKFFKDCIHEYFSYTILHFYNCHSDWMKCYLFEYCNNVSPVLSSRPLIQWQLWQPTCWWAYLETCWYDAGILTRIRSKAKANYACFKELVITRKISLRSF